MNTLKDILQEDIARMGLVQSISPQYIGLAFGVAFLCGLIIYLVYKFFYRGAVYSENFGLLIMMTTLTTSFIIMTISSNIVLSLGMVGALSIVRFRAAVKDPLDVGFLFLGIGAGLTVGAGLFFAALIGTIAVCVIFVLMHLCVRGRTVYLLVADCSREADAELSEILKNGRARLKSKAMDAERVELTYMIGRGAEEILETVLGVEGVEKATLLTYTGDTQY